MKEDVPRKQKIKFKPSTTKTTDKSWVVKTIAITFTMSALFSILSSGVMEMVNVWIAMLILGVIVLTGILFDIIGIAVTTADEAPFHSMATKRVKHANRAIVLIKSKDKVSNFCNDVIGDICGIISGSASTAVAAYIIKISPGINSFLLSLMLTSFVAALTVGGKAMGKSVAIKHSNTIVYMAARTIALFTFWRR
ncbi:MAG: hypothetical protein Q4A86_01610 [Clostridia bacterium]|nr:hypothetical protein [Clostridia bacterium]